MSLPTPQSLSHNNTEDGHQAAIFCYFAMPEQQAKYPLLKTQLFAVPNGASRGDTAQSKMIRGAMLKATGTKAGTSDIILLVPRGQYHGLVLELKKLKGPKPSDEQVKFLDACAGQGYASACYEGWEGAVKYIEWYMAL